MQNHQEFYEVAFELQATSRRAGFGRGRVASVPPDSDWREDFWGKLVAETFEIPAISRRAGFGRGRVASVPPDSDWREDFWGKLVAGTFEIPAISRRAGFGRGRVAPVPPDSDWLYQKKVCALNYSKVGFVPTKVQKVP